MVYSCSFVLWLIWYSPKLLNLILLHLECWSQDKVIRVTRGKNESDYCFLFFFLVSLSFSAEPRMLHLKRCLPGTSLVAQWLRIRLPMQGTWVRSLVREDPRCRRATKPVHHNYWACALEPAGHNYWASVPQLLKPACLEPVLRNKKSHRNEKRVHHNEE